jgi:hypothetical protein
MSDLVQEVIVAIAALGAAAILVRRITSVTRPPKPGESPCANCPSGSAALKRRPVETASPTIKPLTLIRR